MPLKTRLQNLRHIELEINRKLFWVTSGVTIVAMLMATIAFFTRGAFPSEKMSMFYLGVVILYAFHKEMVRWLGEEKIERQGEYFVYTWIGLTTFFYILNFVTRDYFSYSPEGEPTSTIKETASLTIEIFVIFITTRGLKILKILRSFPFLE